MNDADIQRNVMGIRVYLKRAIVMHRGMTQKTFASSVMRIEVYLEVSMVRDT